MFLTSDIHFVAEDIAAKLPQPVSELKTVFINTAAEPDEDGINSDWFKLNHDGFVAAGFKPFDYTLTDKTPQQIAADLKDVDVFHVNGGNMFYLLWKMRQSGFDKFITDKVNQGKVYIGSSSGSIVAGPDISVMKVFKKKYYDEELKNDFTALNLVNFEVYPHWGKDDFHEEYFSDRLKHAYQEEQNIILLPDKQYIEVVNDSYKIISV